MDEQLHYRRQFFLGDTYLDARLEGFATWNRREIAGRHRLSAHPDLPMTHVEHGNKSITLLGFLLDPDAPTAGDAAIVDRLCRELEKSSDLPLLTSRLGGRWVMIAHDGHETVLFHDAAGLRQVYWFQPSESEAGIVCASQPGLIAEVFGLAVDPAALDYVRSRGDSDWEVYWLPGDTSPYEGVKALLPNHLLHLEDRGTARAVRYWPTLAVKPISYERGLRESVHLLRGLVASAAHRYPLAVAMTAGWDSRLMLALSKQKAGDLHCYTLLYPSTGHGSRDVYVPAKLLRKLDIEHHLLTYPDTVDASFKEIVKRNGSSVHAPYCLDTQALRDHYPPERLCLTGDVAEVVKVHYRLPARRGERRTERPTAAQLATVAKIDPHPFALAAFEAWLEGAPRDEPVDLLDLFCWEQMAGRWHGQIRAEYDIVQESFAPLDCRSLLVTMLAVDESHRAGPKFRLFRDMIAELWNDVLQVPINPREKIRWKRVIATGLKRLHLFELIPRRAKEMVKRISRRG
jgi:hypothetical protein